MRILTRLFKARKARIAWEAGLVWYRMRYRDPAGPTHCLKLLSRPEAAGRVALYYRPGVVAELYVGLPAQFARLFQQMAADFNFSLHPILPQVVIPAAQPLAAVAELPWRTAFMAHIIHEVVFVHRLDGGETPNGAYFPQAPSARTADEPAWQLPAQPPAGLTQTPYWNGHQRPAPWVATRPDPHCWLLGRDLAGRPVQVAGRLNLYGRPEAVADWLVEQVAHMVAVNPAGLVVIDGAGNLVPRLKRKKAVTALLGQQLVYMDLDGDIAAGGFNPLAPVPGETATAQVQRWQRWFAGMPVHPAGLPLLAQARQEGVADIPSLQKWLKQTQRQGPPAAVTSLRRALSRLTASREIREWLAWPDNRFAGLPEQAFFLACPGSDWARQQLLRGVLLALLPIKGTRLVVHGFPWKTVAANFVSSHEHILISNGPLFPPGTTILTACAPKDGPTLAGRFLAGEAQLRENLALLGRGESMVVAGDQVFFTSWHSRPGRAGAEFTGMAADE